MTEGMGKSFSTLDDCHQPGDTPGLIQSDGSPGVASVRPCGARRVLDLDFVRTIRTVFRGDDCCAPSFFDQDVRTNRPGLVEEGRTTCAEEFWDVDSRHANELVFAAYGNLVCRHDIGKRRMGDRLRPGSRCDLPVLSDPP